MVAGDAVRVGVGRVVAGAVGDGLRVGVARADDTGDGFGAIVPVPTVGAPNAVGIPCAVGGSGAVECTTNRTVRKTAVTVTAVQDSQTRK